ncbi:MAG: 3D domain-containing protein [Acidobacteriota bacterium]
MSRISCRSFSSVLCIVAVAAVVYAVGGGVELARAADGPPAIQDKSPEVETMEIPGAFKDLPEAKDAITSKRAGEPEPFESARVSLDQLTVDAAKGVLSPTEDRELLDFHATAYCLKGRTASGEHVRPGVIAADPRVLPLGTVVHLRAGRYTGTYTVLDTGGLIRGRLIDVYVPTYKEAIQFGRRPVKIKIVGRVKRARDSKG